MIEIIKKLNQDWKISKDNMPINMVTNLKFIIKAVAPNKVNSCIEINQQRRLGIFREEDVKVDIQSHRYRIVGENKNNKIKVYVYNPNSPFSPTLLGLIRKIEVTVEADKDYSGLKGIYDISFSITGIDHSNLVGDDIWDSFDSCKESTGDSFVNRYSLLKRNMQ